MTGGLAAQTSPPASPFFASDHWSYRALRRLDHAGLLPRGVDLARQSIPQEEIAALFAIADSVAGTNYLTHFRLETRAPRHNRLTLISQSAGAGYRVTSDQYAPGIGFDSLAWTGARDLDNESDVFEELRLSAALAPYLAASIGSDAEAVDVQVIATAGYFGIWGGQRRLGYGTGESGGLVLNSHPIPGGGVFLPRPLRIPVLGPVRFEMHTGKIDNVLNFNGTEEEIEPWFWTARGSFEPFSGPLRVGINRGMMFGGEGNTPVTFSRVLDNIVGYYTERGESNFANQIISVDLRLQVPRTPLSLYLDWASDDGAGGWWDVPAILAGAQYVHVDSTFDVAVGAEHVQFSGTCCGNSIWYRNAWFRGSWADGEDLLGHPLGGHGREWRIFANGSWQGGRVSGSTALFARRRREENLLVPAWEGQSTGVEFGADAAVTGSGRIRALLDAQVEWGANDWTSSRVSVALRGSF